jgi:hypothetical protein
MAAVVSSPEDTPPTGIILPMGRHDMEDFPGVSEVFPIHEGYNRARRGGMETNLLVLL